MLRNSLRRLASTKLALNFVNLRTDLHVTPSFLSISKLIINEENKDYDSDSESEIKICIDFCETPHPKLRNPLPFFDVENEDDEMKSEVENDEVLQIPETSQKSRANSEKSVNKKKLCSTKEASDMSNTTQCSSVVKTKGTKAGGFIKEEKCAEAIIANAHNNQIEDNIDGKELEFKDEKQEKSSVLLKESNHSFVLNNFKVDDNLLASIESHDFMENPHRVLEKPKESKGHFESEDPPHYDFEMDHSEFIGEYNHIQHKQIESSIDNRFEFDEALDNDHVLQNGIFLNDEFMNHPRQFD